jgi:hypothetical protein
MLPALTAVDQRFERALADRQTDAASAGVDEAGTYVAIRKQQ